jgi:hypothetical protein
MYYFFTEALTMEKATQAKTALKQSAIPLLVSTIGSLTAILTAAFFIDGRYAHAEDVSKADGTTKEIIRRQSQEMQVQTQVLRRSLVEDKVFELDAKRDPKTRNLSIMDEAQYKRYTRQLEELNKVIPASAAVNTPAASK